jgi:hypothetical protein
MNFTQSEIGRFIHKHHTSVIYALKLPVPGVELLLPEPEVAARRTPEVNTEAACWAAWVERFKPFRIRV